MGGSVQQGQRREHVVVVKLQQEVFIAGSIINRFYHTNHFGECKVQYVNMVDDVERITGMDFFPALPDSIENVVEAHANLDDWR